jgi:hypothetical protein
MWWGIGIQKKGHREVNAFRSLNEVVQFQEGSMEEHGGVEGILKEVQ